MKVHVFNIYLATAINGGKSVGQKRKRDYISDLLNNERRADVCLCIVQTIWLTISLLRITSKKLEEAKTTWQPRPFHPTYSLQKMGIVECCFLIRFIQ